MIKFLEESDFVIVCKWINKRHLGLVDPQTGTVYINVELLLVETLVHEVLHIKHPDWMDGKIEAKTIRCVRRMSAKRIQKLGKELIKRYLVQTQQKSRKR